MPSKNSMVLESDILAPVGLKAGHAIMTGSGADILPGNALPIAEICYTPSLLAVAAPDNELVGAVLLLAGLVTQGGLAPDKLGEFAPTRTFKGHAGSKTGKSPPWGWSLGFITLPRTVGRQPMWRLRPALPMWMLAQSVSLLESLKKHAGRNSYGRITVRHRGPPSRRRSPRRLWRSQSCWRPWPPRRCTSSRWRRPWTAYQAL